MKTVSAPVFLTAQWRHLAMLNYEVAAKALAAFVPSGTELDLWNGKSYVSIVGFLFLNTRVFGIPIPFHRDFEEVNLRFYVRHKSPDGWRRGVVFVKELVPRQLIAWAARTFYNEPYTALLMAHQIETNDSNAIKSARYSWQANGRQNFMRLVVRGDPQVLRPGSEPEFITEHHWGYTAQRDGSTLEYQVEHPRWCVWDAEVAELQCDSAGLYGESFRAGLSSRPASAFLAEESAVTVRKGVRLTSK